MDKNLQILELDKILQMLKNEASCEEAKERCDELRPSGDFITVCNMLKQTEDTHSD